MTDSVIEFPCEFPIKIMGRDEAGFREVAIDLVEKHAGSLPDDAIRTSSSSAGNFLSITVTITATSQEQLDNIYRDLTDNELVLVAL